MCTFLGPVPQTPRPEVQAPQEAGRSGPQATLRGPAQPSQETLPQVNVPPTQRDHDKSR